MPDYRPIRLLSTLTIFLLYSSSLLHLLLHLGLLEAYGYSKYPSYFDPDPAFETIGEAAVAAGILLCEVGSVLAFFAAVVVFLIWMRRANKNALALGAEGMQFTSSACFWWWFVPVGNLYKPYQAIREIYRASTPLDAQNTWPSIPIPAFFDGWWAAWLLASVISQADYRAADILEPAAAGLLTAATGASLLLTAFLATQVVKATTYRQDEKARRHFAKKTEASA